MNRLFDLQKKKSIFNIFKGDEKIGIIIPCNIENIQKNLLGSELPYCYMDDFMMYDVTIGFPGSYDIWCSYNHERFLNTEFQEIEKEGIELLNSISDQPIYYVVKINYNSWLYRILRYFKVIKLSINE